MFKTTASSNNIKSRRYNFEINGGDCGSGVSMESMDSESWKILLYIFIVLMAMMMMHERGEEECSLIFLPYWLEKFGRESLT